jgi:hypothetical protein
METTATTSAETTRFDRLMFNSRRERIVAGLESCCRMFWQSGANKKGELKRDVSHFKGSRPF